jgi:hypothetical protein
MAICGRCGRQSESAGDVCPSCSEYAPATSSAGTYSGLASRGSYPAASDYGAPRLVIYSAADPDRRLRPGQVEPEFPALPHFERPFAAARTVWPAGPQPAPSPARVGAAVPDLAVIPPEQPDLGHRRRALRRPAEAAGGAGDLSQPLAELEAVPPNGRWIAIITATAALFIAAVVALALVGEYRAAHSPGIDKPRAAARASVSAPASVAPTGQNQLSVDPAAARAPHEAAIVASLNRYFHAINHHDYGVYRRMFVPALRRGLSAASFSAGFGTTTESAEQLRSISVIGAGEVDAFVMFTSRQPTAGRPTCTAWSMELHLLRRGNRYLIAAPPLGYQASYQSCS